MGGMLENFQPFLGWLIKTSIQSSVIICLILIIRFLLHKKIAVRWLYILWLLLLVRMIMPTLPQTKFSPANYIPETAKQVYSEPVKQVQVEDIKLPLAAEQPIQLDIASDSDTQESRFSWSRVNYWNIFAGIWLAGLIFWGLYLIVSNYLLYRSISRQRPLIDERILNLFEDCKTMMGVNTIVGVVAVDNISSPALFGFVRPRLLLPKQMLSDFSMQDLKYVFLHELAHLKRSDILISWITSILQIVHWFNPLVWYAFAKMRIDRELACDSLVLSYIKQERSGEYGQSIVNLLEKFSKQRYMPSMAGILEEKHQMKRRIKMITEFKPKTAKFSILAAIVLSVFALVAFTSAKDGLENKTSSGNSEQLGRDFVKLLIDEKYDDAVKGFDATMTQQMPVETLKQAWQQILSQAGKFQKELGIRQQQFLTSKIVFVTCQFENGPLDVKVVYDGENKISGIWFLPTPEDVLKEYQKSETIKNKTVTPEDKAQSQKLNEDGWALWRERNYAQAEEKFQLAVEKDPANTNALNGLGWSQFNQGKPLEAKEAFLKCVELEPTHPAALNGLGWISKNAGQTEQAIEYWEKAVKTTPNATAALGGLTQAYEEKKDYKKAAQYYQIWVKAEPDNQQAKDGLENAKKMISSNGNGEKKVFDEKEKQAYKIKFIPADYQTYGDREKVLELFNQCVSSNEARTFRMQFEMQNDKPVGSICTYTEKEQKIIIEKLQASSKFELVEAIDGGGNGGSSGNGGTNVLVIDATKPTQQLQYDDDKSAGMESINGGTEVVKFETEKCQLLAFRIFGSRYGENQPPKEDFHIYVYDKDMTLINDFAFPYSRFTKGGKDGNASWVTLKVKPQDVPDVFYVAVDFNPEETKGVYVHHDSQASGNSFIGSSGNPDSLEPFAKGDWMIRAVVKKVLPENPVVLKATPVAMSNDVSPELNQITVQFDRQMGGGCSWTGGGETYPEVIGKPYFDQTATKGIMNVKLKPGQVYWVGINSPSHQNFKSVDGKPAQRYVILFATKDINGNPTPIPVDMLQKARMINSMNK